MRIADHCKVVLALCLVLLQLIFVACQPTPSEEVVPNKGDFRAEQVIQNSETPDPDYRFTVPEKWKDAIETNEWSVPIDAEIITSGQTTFPVRTVKRRDFTLEEINSVANVFFRNVRGIREGLSHSKDEYNRAMLSASEYGWTEYAQTLLEESNSTSANPFLSTDTVCVTELPLEISVIADERIGSLKVPNRSHLILQKSMDGFVHWKEQVEMYGSFDGEGAVSIHADISQENAIETAKNFLTLAGMDDLNAPVQIKESRYFDSFYRREISTGWQIQFMKSYEYPAINLSILDASGRGPLRFQSVNVSPAWTDEYVSIYVSAEGVEALEWHCPVQEEGLLRSNVELMPVQDMEVIIKRMVMLGLPQLEDGCTKFGYALAVKKLILTTTLQPVKNSSDTAYRMPTWVCVIEVYDKNLSTNEVIYPAVDELYYGFNAIDGTRVDIGI